MSKESPAEHLHRSLRITSTARFLASKRLRQHEAWSLWAVTFSSVVILISSLLVPFGVCPDIPENVVGLVQAVGSIAIITISMFVNGNKFGERAEKMHSCALSLNSLTRRAEKFIHDGDDSSIDDMRVEYESVLAQHENHSDTDFLIAQIRRASEYYGITWRDKIRAKIEYFSGFIIYIFLFLAGAFFLYIMLRPI
jgi:hypothetical protein